MKRDAGAGAPLFLLRKYSAPGSRRDKKRREGINRERRREKPVLYCIVTKAARREAKPPAALSICADVAEVADARA